MLIYIFGLFSGILIMGIFAKIYLDRYQQLIKEAVNAHKKLEELYTRCIEASEQMVSDLETKIAQGNSILEEVEAKENVKIIYKKPNNDKRTLTKPIENQEKTNLELSQKHKDILRYKEAGWNLKDISEEVGIGQDQISMIIQLFHQKA